MPSSDPESKPILVPFLKWAGGKRWLTAQYTDLLPDNFDRYIEPFLGSGAVFFHLRPKSAVLSDSNRDLIETYKAIRSNWRRIANALRRHHKNHSERYYYAERARLRRSRFEKAAQFIYLNRTCWNGLYRVNLRGEFNVPIGTKSSVVLESDDFEKTALLLRGVKLVASDFEKTIDMAKRGDFVFVDPPYVTSHNFNGFVKYNDNLFSWSDQERLNAAVRRAAQRGAKILVTNAAHDSIRDLYQGMGRQVELARASILAADSNNRRMTSEIAIRVNYVR
jgi:DNA adenine methylase